MTKLTGVEAHAIVVDRHTAQYNLIFSIAIDIAHRERVEALCGIFAIGLAVAASLIIIGIKVPAFGKLTVTEVPCLDDRFGIDASAEDDRGQHTIDIGHGHTQAGSPLVVVVAPLLAGAAGNEVGTRQLLTRPAVNDGKELWTLGDVVLYRLCGKAPAAIVSNAVLILCL